MHFLKGVNIFSATRSYTGVFERVDGLTEQAPVYVRGYHVGQVDQIEYDFTKHDAFRVTVSMDKHIQMPIGSEMVLVADGLLGGKAIEIVIPVTEGTEPEWLTEDILPTRIEQGLVETLETGLLAHLDSVVLREDSVVRTVEEQLEGDHIRQTLANVDHITKDLTVSATDIRRLTHQQLPKVVDSATVTIAHANAVLANVRQADLAGVVGRVDSTVGDLQTILQSTDGTLGLLLHDASVYQHLDATIQSADSLLTDIKANPKRYINISVFGNKNK